MHMQTEMTVFDDNCFLYLPTVIMQVPRLGENRFQRVEMTATPVEKDEAQRLVGSIRREMRKNKGDFALIADCYLQRVNIPATATAEDRVHGAWKACRFPAPANRHSNWIMQHYGLQVLDAERFAAEPYAVLAAA